MATDPVFDYRQLSIAERLDDLRAEQGTGSPWSEVRARILGKPRQ